jgi:ribosome-associated protein
MPAKRTTKKPTRSSPSPKSKPARARPKKKPARAETAARAAAPRGEDRAALDLAQRIAQSVLDKKASDVVILDVRGMTSYADYVLIGSGESERQVTAMAENVLEQLRKVGRKPLGSEGMETGHWVLLDFGEVVAHLFYTEARSFYDLEGLWADAPKEKVA